MTSEQRRYTMPVPPGTTSIEIVVSAGGGGQEGSVALKLEEPIVWSAAPGRCEPPPEHQDKRWHWLRVQGDQLAVVEWDAKSIAFNWSHVDPGGGPGDPVESFSARQAWDEGWRYVAPCLPPTLMELELGERP